MIVPHITHIGTAVPDHDIHTAFVALARSMLADEKSRQVFDRMAERAGIAHRYACLAAGDVAAGEVDAEGVYRRGHFPGTALRMALYQTHALPLAVRAIAALDRADELPRITHLIVASCTGFTAPGLDLQLIEHLGLHADVQRVMVGFMGCAAAVPALRLAYQAVRSDPAARVLVVNLELCSLHLHETSDLNAMLSFLLFGDGCSAALVSAEPRGIAMHDFRAAVIPDSQDLIRWAIGDHGFDMHLSGKVPARIARALRTDLARTDGGGLLRDQTVETIDLWAVHGGGRTVLDAVEVGLGLNPTVLRHSRAVLHDFGNMSSATVMFALQRIMQEDAAKAGNARGLAMAFGPGMVAETFRFTLAGG
jgi:predicted naringenin-chalcone synthase